MNLSKYLTISDSQAPIVLYFEHLASEYNTLKAQVSDQDDLSTIEQLNEKRATDNLSWNDLYTFELILAKYRPREQLRSRVIQLRNDYRSVAGQQEYDEYIASKPQNLLEPPDPKNPPDANEEELAHLLREDMKDLLGRLFLLYEILPVREAELKRLTWRAAKICLGAMILLFIIVTVMFMWDSGITNWQEWRIPSLTVFVVVIAGAMGGFVSALQRIQRPPSGGDSFYNLAKLYYASYSVFIAPITGGIFAILLYLMFTAGILKGSFFPNIYTPPAAYENTGDMKPASNPSPTPTPSPMPTSRSVQTALGLEMPAPGAPGSPGAPGQPDRGGRQGNRQGNANNANNSNNANEAETANATSAANRANSANGNQMPSSANAGGGNTNANANQRQAGSAGNTNAGATAQTSPSPTPTPTPAPTPVLVATRSLGVKDFLSQSGPAGGVDYAMLILWCFIAGFAERFVPDALDRLISQRTSSANKP